MTQVIVYASASTCMRNSPFVWAGREDEQTLAVVAASDSGSRNTEVRLCEAGYGSIWSLKLHLFVCLLTNLKFEFILISMQMRAPMAVWISTENLPVWHSIFCNLTPVFVLQDIFFFLHKNSETDELQWKLRTFALHDYMWSSTTGPGTLMKD